MLAALQGTTWPPTKGTEYQDYKNALWFYSRGVEEAKLKVALTAEQEGKVALVHENLIDELNKARLMLPPRPRRKIDSSVLAHSHMVDATIKHIPSSVAMNVLYPAVEQALWDDELSREIQKVAQEGNIQGAIDLIENRFNDVLLTLDQGIINPNLYLGLPPPREGEVELSSPFEIDQDMDAVSAAFRIVIPVILKEIIGILTDVSSPHHTMSQKDLSRAVVATSQALVRMSETATAFQSIYIESPDKALVKMTENDRDIKFMYDKYVATIQDPAEKLFIEERLQSIELSSLEKLAIGLALQQRKRGENVELLQRRVEKLFSESTGATAAHDAIRMDRFDTSITELEGEVFDGSIGQLSLDIMLLKRQANVLRKLIELPVDKEKKDTIKDETRQLTSWIILGMPLGDGQTILTNHFQAYHTLLSGQQPLSQEVFDYIQSNHQTGNHKLEVFSRYWWAALREDPAKTSSETDPYNKKKLLLLSAAGDGPPRQGLPGTLPRSLLPLPSLLDLPESEIGVRIYERDKHWHCQVVLNDITSRSPPPKERKKSRQAVSSFERLLVAIKGDGIHDLLDPTRGGPPLTMAGLIKIWADLDKALGMPTLEWKNTGKLNSQERAEAVVQYASGDSIYSVQSGGKQKLDKTVEDLPSEKDHKVKPLRDVCGVGVQLRKHARPYNPAAIQQLLEEEDGQNYRTTVDQYLAYKCLLKKAFPEPRRLDLLTIDATKSAQRQLMMYATPIPDDRALNVTSTLATAYDPASADELTSVEQSLNSFPLRMSGAMCQFDVVEDGDTQVRINYPFGRKEDGSTDPEERTEGAVHTFEKTGMSWRLVDLQVGLRRLFWIRDDEKTIKNASDAWAAEDADLLDEAEKKTLRTAAGSVRALWATLALRFGYSKDDLVRKASAESVAKALRDKIADRWAAALVYARDECGQYRGWILDPQLVWSLRSNGWTKGKIRWQIVEDWGIIPPSPISELYYQNLSLKARENVQTKSINSLSARIIKVLVLKKGPPKGVLNLVIKHFRTLKHKENNVFGQSKFGDLTILETSKQGSLRSSSGDGKTTGVISSRVWFNFLYGLQAYTHTTAYRVTYRKDGDVLRLFGGEALYRIEEPTVVLACLILKNKDDKLDLTSALWRENDGLNNYLCAPEREAVGPSVANVKQYLNDHRGKSDLRIAAVLSKVLGDFGQAVLASGLSSKIDAPDPQPPINCQWLSFDNIACRVATPFLPNMDILTLQPMGKAARLNISIQGAERLLNSPGSLECIALCGALGSVVTEEELVTDAEIAAAEARLAALKKKRTEQLGSVGAAAAAAAK